MQLGADFLYERLPRLSQRKMYVNSCDTETHKIMVDKRLQVETHI